MGYVNVTDICRFIPPAMIQKTAGTWTPALASDVVADVRTAADASFTLLVPLSLPGSACGLQGAKIRSVDVWYKIATAAADDFATVEIVKMTLGAQGTVVSGTKIETTLDSGHDSAAERKAVETHKMSVSLDSEVFLEVDAALNLVMTVDAAAGTVFSLYGAQVNYTLRL